MKYIITDKTGESSEYEAKGALKEHLSPYKNKTLTSDELFTLLNDIKRCHAILLRVHDETYVTRIEDEDIHAFIFGTGNMEAETHHPSEYHALKIMEQYMLCDIICNQDPARIKLTVK